MVRFHEVTQGHHQAYLIRPSGEAGWMVVPDLHEALAEICDGDYDPGQIFEVKIKTYTKEELSAMPEFSGW